MKYDCDKPRRIVRFVPQNNTLGAGNYLNKFYQDMLEMAGNNVDFCLMCRGFGNRKYIEFEVCVLGDSRPGKS